jgi:two-component system LytT family response regulator
MCVHAGRETHVMRITMKALEKQLNPALFQRIHRSTLINVDRIAKLISHINGEYFVMLKSGARLKMSRTYKDKVNNLVS